MSTYKCICFKINDIKVYFSLLLILAHSAERFSHISKIIEVNMKLCINMFFSSKWDTN